MADFDLRLLGVPGLERKLKRLERATQRRIVRKALRESAKRVRVYVVTNLSGVKVNVDTGTLRDAFARGKIRGSTRRGVIRVGIQFPERDELGIHADDPYYYPTAVEYGHGKVPAYPYMRPAVDEHDTTERLLIGRAIGHGIEREAGRA